jgi:alkylation response protein AidB-like acyl-CoA dehydrogenase
VQVLDESISSESLTSEQIHAALDQLLDHRDPDVSGTVLGAGSDDLDAGRQFLQSLFDGGWMVPSWPTQYGGRNADTGEATRIANALADYEVADLYPYGVGLNLVGPVLLDRGSVEQQDQWLRSIADGSEIWCQMFSEPDAGSDLANAGMRADREREDWILTGSKVWTSRGAYARWGMCLARTDTAVPKHRGLTMFAIDMMSSGVEVRPLEQINGDRHFTEVFVSGARVPDAYRIGELGDGWSLTVEMLAHERSTIGGRAFGGGDDGDQGLPSWLEEWRANGCLSEPVARQRAIRALILYRVNQLTVARNAATLSASGAPGPEGSGAKLRSVAAFKARAYLGKDLAGAAGMLSGEEHLQFLTAPSMSIRGGTDEVQRNIVAERILGLPTEPRVDKDTAYADLKKSR